MGSFRLGKPVISRLEYSSGARLPLGKVDPRVFGVHVNSPTDDSVRLHNPKLGRRFLYARRLKRFSTFAGHLSRLKLCWRRVRHKLSGCRESAFLQRTNCSEIVQGRTSGMFTVIAFADGTSMTSLRVDGSTTAYTHKICSKPTVTSQPSSLKFPEPLIATVKYSITLGTKSPLT